MLLWSIGKLVVVVAALVGIVLLVVAWSVSRSRRRRGRRCRRRSQAIRARNESIQLGSLEDNDRAKSKGHGCRKLYQRAPHADVPLR